MTTLLMWVTVFLLFAINLYGIHRLASIKYLGRNRWWLLLVWVTIFSSIAITIKLSPDLNGEFAVRVSLNLMLALFYFATAAAALHPGIVLMPLANRKMEPIGVWMTRMVASLFRMISTDIAIGTLFVTGHIIGESVHFLLMIAAIIILTLHLRRVVYDLSYIGEPMRTIRSLLGTWHWSKTPYDDILYNPGHKKTNPTGQGKPFDIFVSYRSLDVENVRPIVDMLIAGGVKVWFAEYTVLLTDREKWKDAVRQGIKQAKYGLVFSNDGFILSEDCRFEVELLLDPQNCGYKRILEIKIPGEILMDSETSLTHSIYPMLKDSPAMYYDGDIRQSRQILDFVKRETSIPFKVQSNAHATQPPMVIQKLPQGYEIDAAGWERSHLQQSTTKYAEKGSFNIMPGKDPSAVFTRNLGGYRCEWIMSVGPPEPDLRAVPSVTSSRPDRDGFNEATDLVDRFLGQVYDKTNHPSNEKQPGELSKTSQQGVKTQRIFEHFLRQIRRKQDSDYERFLHEARLKLMVNYLNCRGVHLLHLGGLNQRILSFWDRLFWTREYSVLHLAKAGTERYLEIDIIFRFWGPFKSYCQHTYLMDQLVMSLRFDGKRLIEERV